MTYLEGKSYKLQADYYESILLECTYVEDNTIWFVCKATAQDFNQDSYKLDKKTGKLYKWNWMYSSWDNIENTLSEHTADDVWSTRTGNGGGDGYYNGCGQD